MLLLGAVVVGVLYKVCGWTYCRLTCRHRTQTHLQAIFNLSGRPAVFDFSDSSRVLISLPPGSNWVSPLQWYYAPDDPQALKATVLAGHATFQRVWRDNRSGSFQTGPGESSIFQKLEERIQFARASSDPYDYHLVVIEVNYDHHIYRTICSCIQDAEVYMDLCSTPLWIKIVFRFLKWLPRRGSEASTAWIRLMLWFQIRMIRYVNHIHTEEGYIMPPSFSMRQPPWAESFLRNSIYIISDIVMFVSYQIGRWFLGMRAEYEEYTPVPEGQQSKRSTIMEKALS